MQPDKGKKNGKPNTDPRLQSHRFCLGCRPCAPKTIVHSNVLADKHFDFYADVATLRSAHRICGVLSGTLPNLTQQNVFLGLPLVLMPEEFVLLVEKRASSLVFHTTTPID